MNTKELSPICRQVRRDIITMTANAGSGHPGGSLSAVELMTSVFFNHMRVDPQNPHDPDRDRFVLSKGHAAPCYYAVLAAKGFISRDEYANFRQLHSKTPGHPEVGYTAGVETTTGPLGQGIANAVGMAIAEKTLAAQFNRPGHDIVDHYTYAFMGDGCMMEGISHEVCSLAGTLKLGKLVAFYDDNGISIDGKTEGDFGVIYLPSLIPKKLAAPHSSMYLCSAASRYMIFE